MEHRLIDAINGRLNLEEFRELLIARFLNQASHLKIILADKI